MFSIFPKEEKFFDYFKDAAEQLVKGATQLVLLTEEMNKAESHARAIKDIEHRADEITHKTVELLHKTFITPMDREDIHQLITRMDDILDFIEAASERIHLYDVKIATPELKELSEICLKSAKLIKVIVDTLDDLSEPKNIIEACVEINRLENEADHVLRKAMAKLFRDEPDTRQLIKYKEIYELLETVTDRSEDVANIIEGIVLEYA